LVARRQAADRGGARPLTALRIAFNELFGLFVDDGNLALFAVTLVAGVTAS
jgi:hypothetical protein